MGKKTISFVARGELVDWLEEESERRMTSMSSTVQQILAETYREQHSDEIDGESDEESDEGSSQEVSSPFEAYPDAWYEPDGKYSYAVLVPDHATTTDSGDTRYYKTRSGAAEALQRWYVKQ